MQKNPENFCNIKINFFCRRKIENIQKKKKKKRKEKKRKERKGKLVISTSVRFDQFGVFDYSETLQSKYYFLFKV